MHTYCTLVSMPAGCLNCSQHTARGSEMFAVRSDIPPVRYTVYYGIFGRGFTKYTVIYGKYIQS